MPGAELSFVVGSIVLEGGSGEFGGAVAAALATAGGRRLTVREVFALANQVEQIYAQAGFLLVRVVVPPQRLVDRGKVRFRLIDGSIASIEADAVPERHRAVVLEHLLPLVGRKRLRSADLERALLIAGGLAGLKLTSALAAGHTPGATRLILGGTARLLSGAVSVDNRQGRAVGNWGANANLAFNSVFGRGEQIYVSLATPAELSTITSSDSPMQVMGVGMVLPIGLDGLTLNPEYTSTRTFSDGVFGAPRSRGEHERISLRLGIPIRLTRAETLRFTTTLEKLTETTDLPDFSVRLAHDRYMAIRSGFEWQFWAMSNLHLSSSLILSQGLGGRNANDAVQSGVPLSRVGGSPDFTRLNLNADATVRLASDVSLVLNFRGQTSFGAAMLQNERFALDGTHAVSVFASGPFRVDEGATLRAELQRNVSLEFDSRSLSLTPYVFAAGGYGVTHQPTALEPDDVKAGGVGVGVRSRFDLFDGRTSNSVGVELGRQFTDAPGVSDGWRFNVNLSMSF